MISMKSNLSYKVIKKKLCEIFQLTCAILFQNEKNVELGGRLMHKTHIKLPLNFPTGISCPQN